MPANNLLYYEFELESTEGERITQGGSYVVTASGDQTKLVLSDWNGSVIDVTTTKNYKFTSGLVRFGVVNTVEKVDVFGLTDSGQPFQIIGLRPGKNNYQIDLKRQSTQFVIPFTAAEYGTATDTGFPMLASVLWNPAIGGAHVTTAASGSSIDVGTAADPDGIVDGTVTAATGVIKHTAGALATLKGNGENIQFTTISATGLKGYFSCNLIRVLPVGAA